MGYAYTNMVIYGVKLESDKAKLFVFEIAKLIKNDDNEISSDEWKELQDAIKVSDIDLVVELMREYDLWYTAFSIKGIGKYRCDMWGDEADSRCHCTEGYDEDLYLYSVGVFCGAKGYGCNDDIPHLIKTEPTSDCLDSYKRFSAILSAIGVLDAPTVHLVGQTH